MLDPSSAVAGAASARSAARPTDSDIADSGTLTPAEQRVRDIFGQLSSIPNDADVQDDPSRLHSFYKGAQNANRAAMRMGGDPGTVMGATLGGALHGLFDRKASVIDANHEKEAELESKLKVARGQADDEFNQKYKTEALKSQREAREAAIKDREDKAQGDARKSLLNKKTLDFTSPLVISQAKAAGMSDDEIANTKGWDYSKDDSRMVNGVYFDKDKISGVWKQSGLPPELSKQTVPYHVLDENDKDTGDVYQLLPAEAAKLRSSLALQNKRIKSQEEIEGERERARASEGDKNRTSRETIASDNRDFRADADTNRQKYGVSTAQKKYTAAYMEVHPKATPEEVNEYLGSLGFDVPKAAPKAHADVVKNK